MRRADARAANRRALLDAAATLIARDGAEVRLDVIADAAGLTTGAVYSIFGSKNELMVAVLADEIARVDLAIEGYDPALSLTAVIDRYVRTWFTTYKDYSTAQVAFELQVLLSAVRNEELGLRMTQLLEAEIGQLTVLLENRELEPGRLTTSGEAMALARAMKATLTGFGIREPFTADAAQVAELARRSCLALTALITTPS